MRRVISLLVVCLLLLIVPTGLQSQQPPGGKGGKGKGGRGGDNPGKGGGGNPGRGKGGKGKGGAGSDTAIGAILAGGNVNMSRLGDPTMLFDMLANGQDSVSRSDLSADWQIQMYDQMAKGMNITDGKLTRDQFRTAMEAVTGRFNIPGLGANSSRDSDAMADDFFKRADKNNDGALEESEMSDRLKPLAAQYDKNGDGKIDLNEYKEFFRTIMAPNGGDPFSQFMRNGGRPGRVAVVPQSDDLDSHPQVWRYGHLPMDLPDWFEQLDRDRDGQISLNEWVFTGGRTPQDFKMWDRNDDGLVTADEVLAFVRNLNHSNDPNVMASVGGGRGGQGGGRGGQGGGFGGMGGGNAQDIGQQIMRMMGGLGGGGGGGGMQFQIGGAGGDNAGRRGRGNQDGGAGGGRRGGGGDNGGGRGGGRGKGKGGDDN